MHALGLAVIGILTFLLSGFDKVSVVLHNELPESTAIHFHGLITPNAMDGVPGITQDPVDPGQTFSSTTFYKFSTAGDED